MNEVTMFDVRSYLDGEINPGVFNFLQKRKVKNIEALIEEKIKFVLDYPNLCKQLPEHPCSDSMFPVFRNQFLRGEINQPSQWFRILSSPLIMRNFVDITPDFLSYVPNEVLLDNNFLIRFYKYNQDLMLNVIRKSFSSYDRLVSYSYSGNDLNSSWFFQNVTNRTFVNIFAPNYIDGKGQAHFKTKQVDAINLWSLNAEFYIDKIKNVNITPDMFVLPEETLMINFTPGMMQFTQEFQACSLPEEDNTSPQKYSQSNLIHQEKSSSQRKIEPDSVKRLNFSFINESIIGKKAYYNIGDQVIKVKIQNLSYNFEQIFLEVLEDTYPGDRLLVIDASSISHELTEGQAWINPEVFKLIA